MSIIICPCCYEKNVTFLFCCRKKFRCRECYQEVCSSCRSTSGTCHTCFVRERPDANSIQALKHLDSDELEILMKTLHLDPSKKSVNEWINMIAQRCGLPFDSQPPGNATDNQNQPSNGDRGETSANATHNGEPDAHPSISVRTYAITDVNKENQTKHEDSHTSKSNNHIGEEEDDEGIQMEDSPKSNSSPKRISHRSLATADLNPSVSLGALSIAESQSSKLDNKSDTRVLTHVHQRRLMTTDEQHTIEEFAAKVSAWKSTDSQVTKEKETLAIQRNTTVDEAPIVPNIRNIVSHLEDTKKKHVIEIKKQTKNDNLKANIEINSPLSRPTQKETKRHVPRPQARSFEQIPGVHSGWRNKVNVNKFNTRESNPALKPVKAKSTEVISVNKLDGVRNARGTNEKKLNRFSVDVLMSTIASERSIEQMDILQMMKIIRKVNVENDAHSLFKREELVAELKRLWCQANEAKTDNNTKVIIVSNQSLNTPPPCVSNRNSH